MNNKKVAVFTYHFSDNYGAVLQAYSTVNYLQSLGNNVEVINYIPGYVDDGARLFFPYNRKNIKRNLIFLYQKTIKFLDSRLGKTKIEKFREFRELYLRVDSSIVFKSQESLELSKLSFDVAISGSDQIWNPGVLGEPDPVYYLNFKNEITTKISYAASFGTANPNFESISKFRENITSLDAVSVRENSAVDFVFNNSGVRAVHVPDPTFLIEDFSEIIDKSIGGDNYIFSYVLRSGKGFSQIESSICDKLNCKLIKPKNYQRPWLNTNASRDMGPIEWISYLNNSKFVLTNSFHGVALSILLNKEFAVIPLPGKKGALNERAFSLLKSVGLQDRLLQTNERDVNRILESKIDWDTVNEKVHSFREIGRNYLGQQMN